jgi:hypothetical protein
MMETPRDEHQAQRKATSDDVLPRSSSPFRVITCLFSLASNHALLVG